MTENYHSGFGASPATPPPHTGIGRRSGTLMTVVVLLLLVGALLSWVRVDQVVYRPGPVYDTLGAIDDTSVVQMDEDLETYDTSGRLYFTTIRLEGGPGDRLSVWEWLGAELDDSTTVVPREEVFPEGVTAEQVREQNTSLMQHSQEDAAVVALRAAGIEIDERIMVAQVIADAPADGVLHADDEILSVEGEAMDSTEAVRERLQQVEAGRSATIEIRRDGETVELQVPTKRDEETGRTIVGVYLAPLYDMPYDVKVEAGNVGGPSAGLMFALAIYDTITPGALTGGKDFAGTGTISGDGTVGPIGGITQKLYAARDAGAVAFLAPVDNCTEVVAAGVEDLVIVPVENFDEAEQAVEDIAAASDPAALQLPTCQQVLDGR